MGAGGQSLQLEAAMPWHADLLGSGNGPHWQYPCTSDQGWTPAPGGAAQTAVTLSSTPTLGSSGPQWTHCGEGAAAGEEHPPGPPALQVRGSTMDRDEGRKAGPWSPWDALSLTTTSYTRIIIYTLPAAFASTTPVWFHSSDVKGSSLKVTLEIRKQRHKKVEHLTKDHTGR